ncbi:reverse transcriptase [Gossypium australe]|uniref:Reverse transcriptase n=1 Tax=Gossypium australe TaxID=47621 RepID=A0A5B6X104_9ROSI|nr:reverse transcriptase [Gossypium australe]
MQFDDGRETDVIWEMEVIARSYFQLLFSARRRGNYDHILSGIDRCIFYEDNFKQKEIYMMEEIRKALADLGPTKASGEDGLPALFYQKCWSIIGEEVTSFCLNLLNGASINKTNIVLILKISNPSNITQFRPISLCNVLYKLMAKVIANRLRLMIHKCIDLAQMLLCLGD